METDEQLAESARQGSQAAFSELVLRYREKLFRFLVTRCANYADAEDAIQDTFVSAYRYLESFNPRWRFSTWLYRIAIRNAMRKPIRTEQLESVPEPDTAGGSEPLAQCIAQDESENLWLTAKQILAPDAFSAMWLHYVEDMPMKEVSHALDRSLSWTKVTMFRARQRLTKEMHKDSRTGVGSKDHG